MRRLGVVGSVVALVAVLFATLYVVVQQVERAGADDAPQRLASQVAARIAAGTESPLDGIASVDLPADESVWVTVVGPDGTAVASTASLDGAPPRPPAGVIDRARSVGQNRVTWQPRPGLRFATVEVAAGHDVVVAGQSLGPAERRIDQVGTIVGAGFLAALAVVAVGLVVVGRTGGPQDASRPTRSSKDR